MERLSERLKIVLDDCINSISSAQKDVVDKSIQKLFTIENILGDDYDLERLSVMMTQCMSMRDEVAERFRLTANIPLDQLKDLVEADREGRCVILPF